MIPVVLLEVKGQAGDSPTGLSARNEANKSMPLNDVSFNSCPTSWFLVRRPPGHVRDCHTKWDNRQELP